MLCFKCHLCHNHKTMLPHNTMAMLNTQQSSDATAAVHIYRALVLDQSDQQ